MIQETNNLAADLWTLADLLRGDLKSHFADLKEKQIKELLDANTWLAQKAVLLKARSLQSEIGTAQNNDFNGYDEAIQAASKRDAKDGEIGIVGHEIPFNRHFYQYQPPRPLAEIDADLDAVSAEIVALLREVHS